MEEWKLWLSKVHDFFAVSSSLSPLFVKKSKDNRPYLNIQIFDQDILALVDSGSTSSVLGSSGFSLLQKFNLPIKYDDHLNITTADGQPQDLLGYIIIPVTLNSIVKHIKILIIPSVKHNLILGMDFLNLFKLKVNFDNLSYHTSTADISAVNTIQAFSDLNEMQRSELEKVKELFVQLSPPDKIGRTHLITHTIDTGNAKPIGQRQYPLSPAMQKHLNKEIDEMLRLNIIQPSKSPWCSPLWLVEKRSGEYRVCFDGRKLNEVTVSDQYPMPLIDSILNMLRDAKYLSSIDLKQAFFQIPLDESSKPKTAFSVYGKGLFEFCVMPFGLSNSPKTMVRLMDKVIGPDLEPHCFVFLDDIIVATPDFETHIKVLREVYQRLKNANLTVNLKKCEFCRPSLNYLGFVVDQLGLRTDPDKVSAILNYPTPKNTTEIRRLIGLVSWYRRFIKNFASIAAPISNLLQGRKKGQPIVWTPEADEAFDEIKKSLTSAPVLASPDFSKPFVIQCDASDYGVGAILYQECDGIEHPIAYASKALNKAQRNYSVTEKELYSMITAIEKFRGYVMGTEFTVETDHASLKWLSNLSCPSGRLARWLVRLNQYTFKVVHRKGALNVVADALSRSIPETAVLDIANLKPDKWYRSMLERVKNNPDNYPSFRVENNLLYKHIFSSHNLLSNTSDWKIVVPSPNRPEIFQMYHDDATAGHFGISKTLNRILELYYWPNIRQDVYRYVKKCTICGSSKSSNLPRAGLMGSYREINFPFQLVSADLLGPYPRSKNGNQYLLVVVDWFTKYVLVHPMPKATSRNIMKFIENQVFLVYGVPQIFCCDNGSQFISKDFKSLMEKYKVQKIYYNAKYHAQVNHTERINRSIITCIRCYIFDNHKEWDLNIFKIAQAIRLAQHEVTKHSPAFLVFARNIPVSGDYYGKISDNVESFPKISDNLQRVSDNQQLPELFVDIRKRLHKAYLRNANHYNLRKRDVKFLVGDRVWKKNYTLSSAPNDYAAKLAPKYVPCVVNKVLSPLVYNLKDLSNNDLGNWHVKDLKTYYSDLDSDDDEFSETELDSDEDPETNLD